MGPLFDEDKRVELVEGDVLEMAPIGDRHALCVTRLNRLFSTSVGDRALVSVQNPMVLGQHSELQPDVALLIPPLERYTSHPTAADVYLVIEVADSSLTYDRDRKAPLYGRSGVPETWVIDLATETVSLFTQPDPANPRGYRQEHTLRRGETIALSVLSGLVVTVDDVLGPVRR